MYTHGKIGVVTVTYNSDRVLPDFIASLGKQSYRNFLLIAVDNASKDDTLAQLGQYTSSECLVIANAENRGVAAGNNQGIRAAIEHGCEYVLLLNNDVVFEAELFQQLVGSLENHGCEMATPKIYFHQPSDRLWCAGGYFQPRLAYRTLHSGEGTQDKGQFDVSRPVTYAPTCCVLIRRAVFSRIGMMDERYFVYSDDADFMLRAWKAGMVLFYEPHARLWHKVNSLTGTASPFTLHYGIRGRTFFIAKNVRQPWATVATLAYGAYYLLRFIARKDTLAACKIKMKAWWQGWQLPLSRI